MKRAILILLAIVLGATGTGLVSWHLLDSVGVDVASPFLGISPDGGPESPEAEHRQLPVPVLAPAPMKAVRIPRLSISSGTPLPLGRNSDQTMEVPQRATALGWYSLGPAPGARGPAVLAGHVHYNGTPGIFSRLSELRPGDVVEIDRADGTVLTFTIEAVRQYDKRRFPTAEVYGNLDYAGLRLITCAGRPAAGTDRYPDNVVAFARLTSVRTV